MSAVLAFHPTGTTDSAATNRVVCPGCHTVAASMTWDAVVAGAAWRCARCAQHWDLDRLTAVANYGAWLAGRTPASPAGPASSPVSVAR